MQNRFTDENKTLADFQQTVLVACPTCGKKAIAKVNYEEKNARLLCTACGNHIDISTLTSVGDVKGNWQLPAHVYLTPACICNTRLKTRYLWRTTKPI